MLDEKIHSDDGDFMAVALRSGLLLQEHADRIIEHSRQSNQALSDAALTLSILELYEIDAIRLLCQPDSLAPGYVLTGLIGCGAGGMVFRAHQTAMDRDVALKTINLRSRTPTANRQSRIQREARAIARLQHPNIVTAFDSGFYQGRFCIAMELVEGETLLDFIRQHAPLPEALTWKIARQVTSALSHASAQGITHRDIKPANLLLIGTPSKTDLAEEAPFVKVADFGLAFASEDEERSQITAEGTTLGTPAYVAPEQLHDTHVDAKADIYSLGATVFHMLTGEPPYAGRSPMRTIMQKTIGDDRWRDEMPASISIETIDLFRLMTESNANDRIGDHDKLIARMDQLANMPALKRFTEGNEASDHLTDSEEVERFRWPISRVSRWTTAIVVSLGILAGLTSNHFWQSNRFDEEAAQWNVEGFPRPLFNGISVPMFRQSGHWAPGEVSDGSRVLVGNEGSRMTIPLAAQDDVSPNMRLRIGLHAAPDSIVEIGLLHSNKDQQCGVLRFHRNVVDFLPSSDAEDASPAKSATLSASSPEDTVFARFAFERKDAIASFLVNGKQLGSVRCDSEAITSIEVRCIKNASSFADIDLVRMAPQAVSN